jgi:hypothetical protein
MNEPQTGQEKATHRPDERPDQQSAPVARAFNGFGSIDRSNRLFHSDAGAMRAMVGGR